MQRFTVDAAIENIPAITDFVNSQLKAHACPLQTQYEIDIAIDEIVSNVARYGYPSGKGEITVQVQWQENPLTVVIVFIDQGIAYNPLRQKEPNLTLCAQERPVGGLGIFMVKHMMDNVQYERRGRENVLSLSKQMAR